MSSVSLNNYYVNAECYLCMKSNYINNPKKIIVCGSDDEPKHWSHKKCQRQWAMHKRQLGLPDNAITCGQLGNGGCQTNLAHLLPPVPPLPQKGCMEKAVDFFRPVLRRAAEVSISALGIALITGGAMLGIAAGSTLKERALELAEMGIRGGLAASVVAAIGAGGAVLTGLGGAFIHAGTAIGAGVPLQPASAVPETILTAFYVGALASLNNDGWILAGALAAATAISTYRIVKSIFG